MNTRGRKRRLMGEINVVPYIDVMLVLLVIFMVTAPLISPGEIELPTVGSKLTVPVQPLEIVLNPDKTLLLRDRSTNGPAARLTREQLVTRLLERQSRQEQPVVISADKNARYEDVMTLIDLLQRNGVKKVGLLARSPT
jgi:biopolymer transport protein TolR